MRGLHRHSPRTGHRLSREKEYPGTIAPKRTDRAGNGELTNGEEVSSRKALLRRFRDRAQAHRDDVDGDLVRRAALGLQKIKQHDPKDWAAWFALAEWLGGAEAVWMRTEAPVRDPATGRELEIRGSVSGPQYIDRVGGASDRSEAVREHVAELYVVAFDEDGFGPEDLTVL
ncbi:hypothetical protein Hbl1158_02970 [Halobaculum sp. CBA1158]|uniref:hypothetical protein n=1 Tax=Halobaculum sp. CBA1158 TaxID=2904243 RepID=UPI001F2FDEAC|nr:hypothetical protein [Halobaculum sp. CBA1158]UIP00349.1 hypothetical protein Hbl1158_02970 [Halobaculum sp. CBA1158]